jgi:hypothetical protein
MEEEFDYDLDALVVEEESAPPFRFKWGGKPFEMPLMMAMPFEAQLALEEANITDSMQIIMGDAFDELMATPGTDGELMSTGRAKGLFEAWHKHQGLDLGESKASSRSYGNTARRSKRTSRSGRR